MNINTRIESIKADVNENRLLVVSDTPMKILSSAVLNGGITVAEGIINIHVSEECGNKFNDYIHENPEKFIAEKITKLGLTDKKFIGLITAADVRNYDITNMEHKDFQVSSIITAGTFVSSTAGDLIASRMNETKFSKIGTINTIVLINGNLSESCMVQALSTAIEAKTVALRELDIRSRFSDDLATGTVTDSTVIACTSQGELIKYAGTATILGEIIGKTVKQSTKNTINKQEMLDANRPIIQRLKERGISPVNIINLIKENSLTLHENFKDSKMIENEIKKSLSDPIISSIVLACLRLDEDLKMGLIPGMSPNSKTIQSPSLFRKIIEQYISIPEKKVKSLKFNVNSTTTERIGPFTREIILALKTNFVRHLHER